LRQDLIKKWMLKLKESGVTCTSDFWFDTLMAERTTIREWVAIYGVANDWFWIANGVLVTHGRRWRLMIDA
jgi:hypothetical protein